MYKVTKNIDSAFKHIRMFSICFLLGCVILSVLVSYKSYELASSAQERIYILANGKALEAYSADRKDNVPVEARDHVKMFHHYFFTLDPDGSAKQQYDNLKENGYFSTIISGNISQEILTDSIEVSTETYPYYFRYRGQQRIVRPTSIVTRSLVTEGWLRNVSRSDHNAHGFLIERWRTLENKDLTIQNR